MIKVQQNEQGESYILLPADLLERFDWREGDDIDLQTVEVGVRKSLVLSNMSKIVRRFDEDPRPLPPAWKEPIALAATIEESEE